MDLTNNFGVQLVVFFYNTSFRSQWTLICTTLSHTQVRIGNTPGTRAVMNVTDTSSLQGGHLVAVYCENYTQEPVIARCMRVADDQIDVEWLEGSYTTAWKPWKIRDPNNRRKTIFWRDTIPKEAVILFDFELTSSNHLRRATIQHLKTWYQNISSH